MKTFNPYDHFGYLTNRIGRLLALQLGQTLRAQGYNFPTTCIGILADLWAQDGLQQKDLGISLVKTKSSINKMLSSLIAEKLIIKKEHDHDKRGKYIYLTVKGKELKTVIDNHHKMVNQNLLKHFNKEEIALSKRVLGKYFDFLIEEKSKK